nr:DUF368 domain-containing protein [bacterium]
MLIGLGCILPGVSGGVMAVSFGLYRPMLDAVAGLFKTPKRSFLFLLPIGIGGVIGLLCGATVLEYVIARFEAAMLYLFVGLVAGGIPDFIREANQNGFKWPYLVAAAAGAGLALLLLLLENNAPEPGGGAMPLLWPQAILAGAIIAAGMIIPGLSTSFILMYLGWYGAVLHAISHMDMMALACMGVGFAGCAALLIVLVRWAFNRFHGYAYYGVLGFLLVSAALVLPGFSAGWAQGIYLLLMAAGFAAAFFLAKMLKRKTP